VVRGLVLLLLAINVLWAHASDDFFELSLAELVDIKVTTASRSEESLQDTPVAVTVITAQMIEHSGAFNIKQLLTRFVPGFTSVEDQNELNIAVRGIYTSSQQKVLFLLNGHRLNSHSYSMAAPDLSMSLDKIKQIEVLRGPASAVYGNVALTAVVNIILKKGQEHSGHTTNVMLGNYGQKMISHTYGQYNNEVDTFYWLNTSEAEGEKISFSAQDSYTASPNVNNQAILGGQTDKSSFDVGVNAQGKNWSAFFNARRSHYIEPFSAGGVSGEPYDYSAYEKYHGYGPGFGYEMQSMAFDYHYPISTGWQHGVVASMNHFSAVSDVIINPSAQVFAGVGWQDMSVSLLNTLSGPLWQGEALFGLQYDVYRVYDDELRVGSGGEFNLTLDTLMPSDNESISSFFMQHKRHWNEQWLTNVGLRYDYKDRAVTKNIDALSPRLALIYNAEQFSLKMSVAQSFVDSTYWNRFSTLSSFRGADDLEPERLTTYQFSPSFKLPSFNSEYRVTLFYNVADDFIRRDLNALASEPNFSNAGELKSWGLEQEWIWQYQKWNVQANASFQRVLSHENYAVKNGEISNVPAVTANIMAGYAINKKWNMNSTLQYIGEQYSPIYIQANGVAITDPYPNEGVSFDSENNTVSQAMLLHIQLSYQPVNKLILNLQVDNALDEKHEQGGTTLHPYEQTGRWYRFSASYKW
jgi:iron complex outermembrane receptor protein